MHERVVCWQSFDMHVLLFFLQDVIFIAQFYVLGNFFSSCAICAGIYLFFIFIACNFFTLCAGIFYKHIVCWDVIYRILFSSHMIYSLLCTAGIWSNWKTLGWPTVATGSQLDVHRSSAGEETDDNTFAWEFKVRSKRNRDSSSTACVVARSFLSSWFIGNLNRPMMVLNRHFSDGWFPAQPTVMDADRVPMMAASTQVTGGSTRWWPPSNSVMADWPVMADHDSQLDRLKSISIVEWLTDRWLCWSTIWWLIDF